MINERADVSSGRDRLVYSMHLSEARRAHRTSQARAVGGDVSITMHGMDVDGRLHRDEGRGRQSVMFTSSAVDEREARWDKEKVETT